VIPQAGKSQGVTTGPRLIRLALAGLAFCALAFPGTAALALTGCGTAEATSAPEADKVLAVQTQMPFQIMIPSYLPKGFDRPNVEITVDQAGPGGEPMVQLVYHNKQNASISLQEWVPVNPDMEILNASRPIQTKWGRGWNLNQEGQLAAIWADVGPTRVSIYTADVDQVSNERLLAVGDTLGPASNRQVFSFDAQPKKIQELAPPPAYEVPTNAAGVQELTLVVTPGGYSPLRFSVKAGVPVKITFRQLGQVGCGNELSFPTNPDSPISVQLDSPTDEKTVEFTPSKLGTFEFHCSHQMYRGLMTVRA
jgi:hypothetical protein